MTTLNLLTTLELAHSIKPDLHELPKAQLEGFALHVVRRKFGAWFDTLVTQLMQETNEEVRKKLLGNSIDFKTRAVAWNLNARGISTIDENVVKAFRFALMNVARDEAFACSAPSDKFTSPHVVKGREDEHQLLVFRALEELDQITSSFAPVSTDSRAQEASQSVYANDSKELIASETEAEVDRLLKSANVALPSGETPSERLQSSQKALETLLNHTVWVDVLKTPQEHLDRIKTAITLGTQLRAAQFERTVAHSYVIAGDTVVVPRISAFSTPETHFPERQRGLAFVITSGWDFLDSGVVHATSFDDARQQLEARYDVKPTDHSLQVFVA